MSISSAVILGVAAPDQVVGGAIGVVGGCGELADRLEGRLVVASVADGNRREQAEDAAPVRGGGIVDQADQERYDHVAGLPPGSLVADVGEQLGQRRGTLGLVAALQRAKLPGYVGDRSVGVMESGPRDRVEAIE